MAGPLSGWVVGQDSDPVLRPTGSESRRTFHIIICGPKTGAAGDPVLVRQGKILAATFHPELSDDTRVHQEFVKMVENGHRRK